MRRLSAIVLVAGGLVLCGGVAWAAWNVDGSGDGSSRATVMPTGERPTASVSGRNVTVSWNASELLPGDPVNGYRVVRYDGGSIEQAVGSSCSGTINALTCVEAAVPPGTWRYAIVPKQFGWLGVEGPVSTPVTVAGPTLTLTPPTNVTSLPKILSGSIQAYITGETVTYRLDDPATGTVLVGSITPDPVPASGSATVSVTLPIGIPAGVHSVYAVGSLGTTASASIRVDLLPPTVSSAVVAKTAGGTAGYVKQGGTYYVYANVTDPAPGSGVKTVTANVSAITTGQTAVTLSAGTFTVDGVTYNYRSGSKTASSPLAAGAKAFTITATDVAGNQVTQGGFTVTVDNTAPTVTDVQTANNGSTAGRAEVGDTATFTFSEPIEPGKVLSGWNGASTTVTVRLVNNSGGDRIQVWNAANTTKLPFGTVNLGNTSYVSSTVTFSASTMTMAGSTITVTLGTPSGGTLLTAAANGSIVWTPSSTPTDRAGNACSTAAITESGAADLEF
ncbi:MAG TPA: hypothetical protein VH989_01715 [Actinomycetota bacterium]|jgi:hypothetical protein